MDFTEPPKPAVVNLNPKTQEIQVNKTYFYEMPNGKIEPVEAKEAWELHKKKYKQIGVSDGSKYRQAIAEARQIFQLQGLEMSQERLRKGFEEELEVARGNFETPPSNDVWGNGRNEFNSRFGGKMR
jgi:hypothetical protein